MNRIGLLGGSFNPVHLGHVGIARAVCDHLNLDRFLFIPNRVSPFKVDQQQASDTHRRRMLELALADEPGMEICPLELERGGISYTVDTLRVLQAQHPDTEFYFVIGADNLEKLHLWREIDALFRLTRFVLVARPGWAPEQLESHALQLSPNQVDALRKHLLEHTDFDISSSEIRRRLGRGESVQEFLAEPVLDFIRATDLYTAPSIHPDETMSYPDNPLLQRVTSLLLDQQAENLCVLDMRELSSVTDFYVIASGNSWPHLDALYSTLGLTLKNEDELLAYRKSGNAHTGWIVMDYVDLVVHLMSEEMRDYYALERLWSDAPRYNVSDDAVRLLQ